MGAEPSGPPGIGHIGRLALTPPEGRGDDDVEGDQGDTFDPGVLAVVADHGYHYRGGGQGCDKKGREDQGELRRADDPAEQNQYRGEQERDLQRTVERGADSELRLRLEGETDPDRVLDR